jgi:hypothetical protein
MGTDAFAVEGGEPLTHETVHGCAECCLVAVGRGGGYLLVFEVEEAVLLQDEPSLLPVLANVTYTYTWLVTNDLNKSRLDLPRFTSFPCLSGDFQFSPPI